MRIKGCWRLYRLDYLDKQGRHHGSPADGMGYVVYRDKTRDARTDFPSCAAEVCTHGKAQAAEKAPVQAALRRRDFLSWLV